MSRVPPRSLDDLGELADIFGPVKERMGFIPVSQLVMAHKPELVRAFVQLTSAVWGDSEGSIPRSLKGMIAVASSLAAGCMYCTAHTGSNSSRFGVEDQKIAAIWEFETSDLFDDAERAALRFAQAASAVPNMTTDADFEELRQHFTEFQIVEIVSVISLFGYLNRWNDTMATALEDEPVAFAERAIRSAGWDGGKHIQAAE